MLLAATKCGVAAIVERRPHAQGCKGGSLRRSRRYGAILTLATRKWNCHAAVMCEGVRHTRGLRRDALVVVSNGDHTLAP